MYTPEALPGEPNGIIHNPSLPSDDTPAPSTASWQDILVARKFSNTVVLLNGKLST